MKNFCRTIVASALVVLILVSLFSILPVAAENQTNSTTGSSATQEVRYTEKIVAVLFDDSGSMDDEPRRLESAQYAMESLMSLLDTNDTLVVTFMNNANYFLKVDLTKENRNDELTRVMNTGFFCANGGTPSNSLAYPINALKQYGLGDNLPNKEYWMIIMTDGEFDGVSSPDHAKAVVEKHIKDYSNLHSVYMGFGKAVDLRGKLSETEYPLFKSFKAEDTQSIVSTMQEIAGLLSGRFKMNQGDDYVINGDKVTIKLDKTKYSLKNISIITQNSGATITSVNYNGNSISVSRPCIIPGSKLSIQDGFSGTIEGNPFFFGGTIEIKFSSTVNNLFVLAEPALSIEAYMEYQNSYVEESDISKLRAGDMVRIQYEVIDQCNMQNINLSSVFGSVETKVSYAGKNYKCGENFALEEGNNLITVEVSVMNGKYVMYDTLQCVVMADPSYYRVEAQSNDKISPTTRKVQTVYTVYIDNKPATKAQLDGIYTWECSLLAADGTEVPLTVKLGSDGKISTEGTVPEYAFGTYTQNFTITSDARITRDHTCQMNYYPDNIVVSLVAGGGDSINESQLAKGQGKAFEFELLADGKPLAFDSGLTEFTLKLDGINVSSFCTTDGNKLIYVPTTGHTGKGALPTGTKEVELTVQAIDVATLTSTAKGSFTLTPSAYVVEALPSNNRGIDRFDLDLCTAELYFRILRDGEALTPAEVKALYEDGAIKIEDDGTFSSHFWLPCGIYGTPEEKDGQGVITVRVERDMINPFQTFFAMLIFSGEEAITVSYLEASDSTNFVFESSSLWSYIWRILIILLIIYIIIYCIGFWKCKMLPSGTFLCFNINSDGDNYTCSKKYVNLFLKDKIIWHAKRFINPIRVWGDQDPESFQGYCKLYYDKSDSHRNPRLLLKKDMVICEFRRNPGHPPSDLFTKYMEKFRKFEGASKPGRQPEVDSKFVRKLFAPRPVNGGKADKTGLGAEQKPVLKPTSTPYFGKYDDNNVLEKIITYIQVKK